MNSSELGKFPVQFTRKINDISEIKPMIDEFVDHYKQSKPEEFSWRILLPRHLDSDYVKRLGADYSRRNNDLTKEKQTNC